MAYQGFLIKFNKTGYIFPLGLIRAETYKITPRARQDLDSYRDMNGVLNRDVLEHTISKIEWEIKPMLTNLQIAELCGNLKKSYENESERRVSVTYYNPETDNYDSGIFYMPDVSYVPYYANDSVIKYNSMRYALIEY